MSIFIITEVVREEQLLYREQQFGYSKLIYHSIFIKGFLSTNFDSRIPNLVLVKVLNFNK